MDVRIEKISCRFNSIGTQFFQRIAGTWPAAHVHEHFHLREALLVCHHFVEMEYPYAHTPRG